jgi:hypothetical protein
LREIQGYVFWDCESLKSISLPASLSVIDGSAFLNSSIENIVVDDANPNYFVSGRFLIRIDGMTLIRYFGDGEDLKADCLFDLGLGRIGRYAFYDCSALKSICIPSSIEILDKRCFSYCSSLSQVIFESGSKLTQIRGRVFIGCSSLTSICVPANVEHIFKECFFLCTSLIEASTELGSELARIAPMAFSCCRQLRSFVIPAQLEIIGSGVFQGCKSLCELIFDIPSQLRQLDLPPSEFGSLSIPDCVEVVSGGVGKQERQRRLLHFGRESCLSKIELRHSATFSVTGEDQDTASDSFVNLSEEVLRRFRCEFEAL